VLPNSFYMDLAIRMAINAVIVLGLNLLIGFAGQISLGHAGFLGIGCLRFGGAAHPLRLASAAGHGGRRCGTGLRWPRWWPGRSSS
jgi:ABC-type branched-subunit amino acid transport system permease subunit